MKKYVPVLACLLFVLLFAGRAGAQNEATINVQGVLRKANGVAVEDGPQSVTFLLYTEKTGGTAKWSEQQEVTVSSGIYTAVLGETVKFKDKGLAFDTLYYLALKLGGGAELTPRVPLTPAPYALALLGDPNKFPSNGAVRADGIVLGEDLMPDQLDLAPDHTVVVKGGILARGGMPGTDGEENNGYAFLEDMKSGLFSTGVNEVSLYTENVERLKVTNATVKVNNDLQIEGNVDIKGNVGDVNLDKGKTIKYNGVPEWKLFYVDDFHNSIDDWEATTSITSNNLTPVTKDKILQHPSSAGWKNSCIYQTVNNGAVLRKLLDFKDIPHTRIKVKFIFYALDTWDDEYGYAGFIKSDLSGHRVGWGTYWDKDLSGSFGYIPNPIDRNMPLDIPSNNNSGSNNQDYYWQAEMTLEDESETIYLYFSSTLNSPMGDECFAVSHIEIWVR